MKKKEQEGKGKGILYSKERQTGLEANAWLYFYQTTRYVGHSSGEDND